MIPAHLQPAEPVVEPAVQHPVMHLLQPVVPVEPVVHQKSKQIVEF